MIQPLRLRWLGQNEIDSIHNDSLEILWEDGIKITHQRTLALLAGNDAIINNETNMVRIPPELVERCIASAPREFVMAGRLPEQDITIPGDNLPYVRSVGGNEGYNDIDTGEYRLGKQADIVEFSRIFDGLKHIDVCCGILPCDVRQKARDVTTMKLMLENTSKHCCISVDDADQLEVMIKMASAIQGGDAELRHRPLFTVLTSVTSPRSMLDYCVDVVTMAGKHGIPVLLNSTPLMGATCPVTIAGFLTQCNLEILALLTVSQLANPGAPVLCRPIAMTVDMSTGNPVSASVECAMATGALVQLILERYGLPVEVFGTLTESLTIDGQAQIERNTLALLSAISGATGIGGVGELGDGASLNPVQLVIDNEIAGNIKRCLTGFTVDQETRAKEVITKVRPGMEYMSEEHTLNHFRQEHWFPQVFTRDVRQEWLDGGAQTLEQRAREQAKRILAEHQPLALPDAVQTEIDRIYDAYLESQNES